MAQLDDLILKFRKMILQRCHSAVPGGAQSAVVAFEFGTPIPEESFRTSPIDPDLSLALAREYISHQANVAPFVSQGLYSRRAETIDGQYELMLAGARPLSAE